MKNPSLRIQILLYAKKFYPFWVNGGAFERLAEELGYKASNASRRCRELCREGKFERRENIKGCVEYRFFYRELTEKEKEAEKIQLLVLAMK